MTAPAYLQEFDGLPRTIQPAGEFDWEQISVDAPDREDGKYVAIIDLGSGSARAVVMRVNPAGGVEIIAQQRMNLNLMSHVDSQGAMDTSGVSSTVEALEDFALLVSGFGIRTVHAVGTAALRESGNADGIIDAAINRFGIPLRIIDGSDEAAYCFLGAIHGLPVSDGLLADIGGGSVEIVGFTGRRMCWSVSLPLGSLRMANRFGLTDLSGRHNLDAAYRHVRSTLMNAGIPHLGDGGVLVTSGGSARLLSRLDRGLEPYPIIKTHGYEISALSLERQVRVLSGVSLTERAGMVGMNPERSNSIVGGAVVAHALAQHTAADSIMVSGQGLREGLARMPDSSPTSSPVPVPTLPEIRMASLVDLVRRFVPRFWQRGIRRAALAQQLGTAVWGDGKPDIRSALECAAFVLDIGNAVDYYNRMNRTASIIVRTDLPGFTHKESANIAAVLLSSDRGNLPPRFRHSRLFEGGDIELIDQAAAALRVVDELETRLPNGTPPTGVRFALQNGILTVSTPAWSRAAGPGLYDRWAAAFGNDIEIVRCES